MVAEREAREASASAVAAVLDTASTTWQAREVVICPMSATARGAAVAKLMFQSSQTWCHKGLQINVTIASCKKVVSGPSYGRASQEAS